MNLTKFTATTILALTLALPTGAAFSQEREETVDQNLNQAEEKINQAAEAAEAEIAEIAAAIEERSNWGWLGLLGLLGLFGLAGRNKKTIVVEERRNLEPQGKRDRTTMNSR